MNWGGFPVGFRFPVKDFSLATKQRCWSHVLRALVYSDLTECSFYEAETAELFDPERLIYIAVISTKLIPVNRKNSLLWRTDGQLMSEVVLYQPVSQENYLELYTHPVKIADVTPDRYVIPAENAADLFPNHIEYAAKPPVRIRALIIPKGDLPFDERLALCRRTMRDLYEADNGLYLKILPLSPGGEGAVYTAAAFQHGRLFTEMIPDKTGEKHRCLFGVLPGRKLLIDGFSLKDVSTVPDEQYGLGMALRIARDRGFSDINICAKGLNAYTDKAEPVEDLDVLYSLSRYLPLYDRVILTEYDENRQIKTEAIKIDRRDKKCVSLILSKRSGTEEN